MNKRQKKKRDKKVNALLVKMLEPHIEEAKRAFWVEGQGAKTIEWVRGNQ